MKKRAELFSLTVSKRMLLGGVAGLAALSLLIVLVAPGHAQLQTPTRLDSVVQSLNDPAQTTEVQRRMARQINAARQKEILKDTVKLLVLANELKRETESESSQREDAKWSPGEVKKADQIAKLAHRIRNEMVTTTGAPTPSLPGTIFQTN